MATTMTTSGVTSAMARGVTQGVMMLTTRTPTEKPHGVMRIEAVVMKSVVVTEVRAPEVDIASVRRQSVPSANYLVSKGLFAACTTLEITQNTVAQPSSTQPVHVR